MTGRTGLVLFDFDGTLYRGDDPFRFYAAAIARHMTPAAQAAYLDAVERHLRGEVGVVAGDNWEAVVQLAAPYVNDPAVFEAAFLDTRRFMMGPDCVLEVPAGLPALLTRLRPVVVLAVASNSPEAAAIPLLGKLGLLGAFDDVRHSAQKPDGLLTLIDELTARYRLPPDRVMSVGDNYRNDIAPAVARGLVTAHISPRGYFPGPATYRGRTLEDVLPAIEAWALGTASAARAGEA